MSKSILKCKDFEERFNELERISDKAKNVGKKPLSASKKGQYYKLKTKKWLESKGYQVVFLEQLKLIHIPGRPVIPVKRDQMGSDLMAVSDEELIFVQVKLGKANVSAARKEFDKFVFPDFCKKWIVTWEVRAKEPEVENYKPKE